MTTRFNPSLDEEYPLPEIGSWPATKHLWISEVVLAIQTALAIGRPLLLRGEPGLGKSQIARAAAAFLQVPFLPHVVHGRCEAHELLYSYDAVSRLAQAQVLAAGKHSKHWESRLSEGRFVQPGILWWALDWNSAETQAAAYHRNDLRRPICPVGWQPEKGCVVLIDEIDKADSDVPNGLLESLGNLGFDVPLVGKTVSRPKNVAPPLVIITTNEERELPAAFLRRCLVLSLVIPEDETKAKSFLMKRGQVHFGVRVTDLAYSEAADLVIKGRKKSREDGGFLPGAAEYLDLLHALAELHPDDPSKQTTTLKEIANFALKKNPEPDDRSGFVGPWKT